jgi:hypothetical protein
MPPEEPQTHMTQASEQNVHSGSDPHAGAHAAGAPHAADAGHGAAGGHGSGHGSDHGAASLGPIDRRMWGAGILATAVGLVIVACFMVATASAGAY